MSQTQAPHSLRLSILARVCSEHTRAGCSLERPRAAAGRAMKGHRGNRSSGRRAAGLCSGLSTGPPAAPCHARPLHQPALRPQALTQGSLPTGPSPRCSCPEGPPFDHQDPRFSCPVGSKCCKGSDVTRSAQLWAGPQGQEQGASSGHPPSSTVGLSRQQCEH